MRMASEIETSTRSKIFVKTDSIISTKGDFTCVAPLLEPEKELGILGSCDYIYCQLAVHLSLRDSPPLFPMTIYEYNSPPVSAVNRSEGLFPTPPPAH